MSDTSSQLVYPYGQDWLAQLAMRRAEASRPLEERGIVDPRWRGNTPTAPAAATIDMDALAEAVAEKLAAAVRPPVVPEPAPVVSPTPVAPVPASAPSVV